MDVSRWCTQSLHLHSMHPLEVEHHLVIIILSSDAVMSSGGAEIEVASVSISPGPEVDQLALLQKLEKFSKECVISGRFHATFKDIHKGNPGHFILVRWQSKSSFDDAVKAGKQGAHVMFPITLVPHAATPPTDPFHDIQLPEHSRSTYLVVFRIRLDSGCSHLSVLFRVPIGLQLNPWPNVSHILSEANKAALLADKGYRRYSLGQCSACAANTKLWQCSGCRLHGYCSKTCQRSLWKTHKALCRPISAVTREASARLKDQIALDRAAACLPIE